MEQAYLRIRIVRASSTLAAAAGLALLSMPAWSQSIDADADAILRAMADQLKSAKAFTVDYDADNEIVDKQGQKLQYSATGAIAADRTAGFLITRQGPFADAELTFDGKKISLYGRGINAYVQMDSPGRSIEEAVQEFRMATDLDAAGADLLSVDPYSVLTEGVTQGSLVGTGFVGGVECDHLAFRTDSVDWQIWISQGEPKLPLKYVITTKWVTAAPQYSLTLRNWNIGDVDAKQFSFTAPADARKLEEVNADVVGDITTESE